MAKLEAGRRMWDVAHHLSGKNEYWGEGWVATMPEWQAKILFDHWNKTRGLGVPEGLIPLAELERWQIVRGEE